MKGLVHRLHVRTRRDHCPDMMCSVLHSSTLGVIERLVEGGGELGLASRERGPSPAFVSWLQSPGGEVEQRPA